jgi:hypothetical protein
MNTLGYALLVREAAATKGGGSVQGRVSADFVIDGTSLLQTLVKADGGHSDFMGCFVRGFPEPNRASLSKLLAEETPNTEDGRTLVYICPECGDIGCGAYAARIGRVEGQYTWSDFAYVNGYEPAREVAGLGPFTFSEAQYKASLKAASAL